ncbi:MAG: hypothetical protein LBB79_05445 [Prevotellaceae bacterium]|jgi:hypothetical protein|nr:hypothetical protein [Prevotellaceae bacterium]
MLLYNKLFTVAPTLRGAEIGAQMYDLKITFLVLLWKSYLQIAKALERQSFGEAKPGSVFKGFSLLCSAKMP